MIPSYEADNATERKFTQLFNMPLIAMFPYEPDVQMKLSSSILVVKKPEHDFAVRIRELATRLIELQQNELVLHT